MMESELERLRRRIRQLERELRTLRGDARDGDAAEPSPAAVFPPASDLRRWASAAPVRRVPGSRRP